MVSLPYLSAQCTAMDYLELFDAVGNILIAEKLFASGEGL